MKRIFLSLLFPLMSFSCVAQLKSNKAEGYDKKITGNLTVYITVTEDKQRSEWGDKISEKLTAEFAARNIEAGITVYMRSLQRDAEVLEAYGNNEIDADSLSAYLNPRFATANENGLVLLIDETMIGESAGYSGSDFTLSLMDTGIGRTVWKAKIHVIFKGNITGAGGRVKSAANHIMKALQKDGLL